MAKNMEAASAAMEDVAAAAWKTSVAMRKRDKAVQRMFNEVTTATSDATAIAGRKAMELQGIFEAKLELYAGTADLCQNHLEVVLNEISLYRAQIQVKKRELENGQKGTNE